jgi:dolichol-phosphate mannosyltransferase
MSKKPQPRKIALEDVRISLILPVYNEEGVLVTLVQALKRSLTPFKGFHEIIFVNDGSSDDTASVLDEIANTSLDVRVLHLSRNFGHQAAIQAGLDNASGDVIIVMDSDMQDDPSIIPRFVDEWEKGYDVVYAVRVSRKEGWIKRLMFYSFYRFLNAVAEIPIPLDAGNFGLIDRRVADEIITLYERDRYYPGLRSWVGFHQTSLEVERGERYDKTPRVPEYGLWGLAKSALFSFSAVPLIIFYAIALLCIVAFLGTACFTLYHKLLSGLAIPGWTSILMVVAFFGAVNSLGVAVVGEYLVRIYDQVRRRPIYIVMRKTNFPN